MARANAGAWAAALAVLAAPGAVQAGGASDPRWYVEAGTTPDGGPRTHTLTAGVLLPSAWFGGLARQAGPLSLHWDLWLSHWRVPTPTAGHAGLTQIGAVATWRHALGGPGSPWFVDLGLGLTLLDRLYATPRHRFSTRYQFTEVIGLGWRFGERQTHEVSLRYQHFSNGGIERPNPGENFVRLRWAFAF